MTNHQLTLDAYNTSFQQFLQDKRVRDAQSAAFRAAMLARMTLQQLERIQGEPRKSKSAYDYPGNIKARTAIAKNRNYYSETTLEDKAFNNSYQKFRLTYKNVLEMDMAGEVPTKEGYEDMDGFVSNIKIQTPGYLGGMDDDKISYHKTRRATMIRNLIRTRPYKIWLYDTICR